MLYELFVKYSDFIDENYEYITEVSGSDSFLLFETSFDMTHCETFLEESGKISYDGLKMELTYTQFVDDEDIEDDDIEWDSNESVIFRKKLDVTEWNKFSAYLKRCQKLINDSYNGTNKNR